MGAEFAREQLARGVLVDHGLDPAQFAATRVRRGMPSPPRQITIVPRSRSQRTELGPYWVVRGGFRRDDTGLGLQNPAMHRYETAPNGSRRDVTGSSLADWQCGGPRSTNADRT